MLPFDNKSEFQVIVDMPNGTTLEQTTRVSQALGQYLGAATGGCELPGVLRHLRARTTSTDWCGTTSCGTAPNQADIQVNLLTATSVARRVMRSPSACGRNWSTIGNHSAPVSR